MDEESILFGIRSLFALGNYQAVINEVSSASGLYSPEAKLEAQTFLYRSYVAQGKFNLVINDINNAEPSLVAIKLLASYMADKQKGASKASDIIQQAHALLEDGANRIHGVIQVVVATIFVQHGLLEDALRTLHSRQKKLEWYLIFIYFILFIWMGTIKWMRKKLTLVSLLQHSSALAVQIYLQLDRLDLARNEVNSVKTWAEDALLLQMMEAWVDLRVVRRLE